jgi:chitodextrinase
MRKDQQQPVSNWSNWLIILIVNLVFAFGIGIDVKCQSTVYIDPSYTDGNNDGSLQHPFKSWKDITDFQDYVFYAQRRGTKDTINGSIFLYQKTGIQLGVYGSGTDYAHIHNLAADIGRTINLSASGHCSINGFHLTGSYETNCGISVGDDWQASTFVGNNIKISNCFIEKSNWGIRSVKMGNSPYDTLIIENVKIHNIFTDGIFIQGWGTPLRGLDINNCYIDSVNQAYYPGAPETVASGDGIQLSRLVDHWVIRNTTIDRRNTANKFCIIHNDEALTNTCSGTIENCTLYSPNVGTGGCNIYLSNLATATVKNNRIFCNDVSVAMMIRGKSTVTCDYNVFSKMGSAAIKTVFDVGSGPTYFHNNTIYGASQVFITGNFPCEVFNNVFHSAGTVYSGTLPATRGNNLFFNSTGNGTESGSIYSSDPLLTDPANGIFTLGAGSPCVDKARNLGYAHDIVNTPLPQLQGYDMGAYEYYSGVKDTLVKSVVYIDPSYSGGNNDGTAQRPFRSLKDITAFMDDVTYLQRRGTRDTVNGGFSIYRKSGTKFGVYGSGTDYAHLHNSGVTSNAKTFNFSASNNCSINGFHLTGSYVATCAISVGDDWQASSFLGNNTKISNCFIEKFNWGIRSMKLGNSPYENLLIDSVRIRNIYTDGIFVQGWGSPFRGLDINHCYIDSVNMAYYPGATEAEASGDGIQLSRLVDGWIIHNTTVDRRGTANKFCIIHNDEALTNTCGGTIENCTLYSPNVGTGGCNIYLSNLTTVNIRKNLVFCNEVSEAMMIRGMTSVRCYSNVFSKMETGGGPKAVFDIGSGPNYFHNNTIYGATVVFFTPNGYSSEVYNNIFASAGTVYSASVLTAPANNVYYSSTVSGTESGSIYNIDPRFVSPTSGDFHLRRGSPAIDKGRNLGYTTDLAGQPTPQGSGYDIGAYEYIPTDNVPPTTPAGLTSGNITYTGFTLSWNPSTDNIGIVGYDVYKNDTLAGFVTGTSISLSGLTQGTTYNVSVKARDEDGNISQAGTLSVSTTVSSDNAPPSVPSGLTATNISQSKFTLTWDASTDNVGVSTYDVYNNNTFYATVSGTSVLVNTVPASVNNITIKAKDIVGNTSAASSLLAVTTLPICTGLDAWTNMGIAAQTGTFVTEYDVTPDGDALDGVTGLSDGNATAYGNMACIVRFNPAGFIDARNGGAYEALNSIPYTGGITYHIKIAVNVANKKYDAYVRQAGSTEDIIVASQYGFRALPTQLNNFVEQTNKCHLTVANLSVATTSDTEIPTTPAGFSYSNLNCTSLTLNWNASTDNVGVTGYDVLKNGITCFSVIGTSATVSGLSPATTYNFTVRAKDISANVSAESITLPVTTPSDTLAPSIPSGLNYGYVTETDFTLMWDASSDNVGVTGYDIFKNGVLVTSVTGATVNITGLTQGTSYNMTVKAKDAAGNVSAASNILIVNTANSIDPIAPSIPCRLSYNNLSCTNVTLTWNASTDNVAVTGYEVFKNGTFNNFVTGTSVSISGLSQATSYCFTVRAKDGEGNASDLSTALCVTTLSDTQAPSVPSGLTASSVTSTTFTLGWTASSDNVGVTSYDVYKDGVFFTSVTGTSVNLTGLTQGITYSMTVKAKDATGNISGASNALLVSTGDTSAPSIPAGLVSSNITMTSFTLSWNASTDNVAVTGYDVYKNGALVTSVSTTSVSITGLTSGTAYAMTVKAKDAAGNASALSTALQVTTPGDTLAPSVPSGLTASSVTGTTFTLGWTASSDNVGVTGYDVYKDGVFFTSVTGTSVNLTGLTQGVTYSMTVKAKDAAGNISGASNSLLVLTGDTSAPSIPAGLVSSNITSTSFTLSWNASTDNVAVTGYDVYKNGALATSVSTTSVSITGLTSGTAYAMTVKAKDAAGNISAGSTALTITTSSSSSNLALNKNGTASSVLNNNPSFIAGKAFDGATGTRWVSSAADANWIYVDLAAFYDVSSVVLNFSTSYFPSGFKVQVSSDASSWTDVYSTTTSTSGGIKQITFSAVTARYVRMLGTKLNLSQGQYNLYEFEVYGTASLLQSSPVDLASDNFTNNEVLFYPNPATDWINVQLETRSTVRIMDMNGKIVFSTIAEQGTSKLSIRLAQGSYILQIVDINKKVYSKGLIIK